MKFRNLIRLSISKYWFLMLLGAFTASGSAYAADGNEDLQERLLACNSIEDQEKKLECFDLVVGNLRDSEVPVTESNSPQPTAVPAAKTAETTSAPEAVSSEKKVPAAETVRASETVPAAKEATVPAAVTNTAPVGNQAKPVVEASVPNSDFGLKKKKQKDGQEEQVIGTIVRVWTHQDERFSVELDNGQRWRETSGSRVGKPKEGAHVTISTGTFGGYRMKIEGITRISWVRRTK